MKCRKGWDFWSVKLFCYGFMLRRLMDASLRWHDWGKGNSDGPVSISFYLSGVVV